MVNNIITAVFGSSRHARTREIFQWDYGMVLRFAGITLPETYTVHFANQLLSGTAKTQIGGADGVAIPDEYLTTGLPVYAWVFLHTGDSDGETRYTVEIPVTKRPRPTGDEPTLVQQGLIDQAIAALNAGVARAEDAAERAEEAADRSEGGGGEGTSNYNALSNKPSIEGNELRGDKSFKDLGLIELTPQEIDEIIFGGA